jgi:hypothetical protein
MHTLTCAEMRELAPELALGVLGGAERADALAHVEHCGPCRAVVSDLTATAEVLPLAAPEAEPPPGFEGRTMRALGASKREARLRWAKVVAFTAAAAAIVSIVMVRVVDRGRDDTTPVASLPSDATVSDVWSAPMITPTGDDVGRAFVSDGTPAAVGLDVRYYAMPTGDYTIEAHRGDGTTADIGTVAIVDGHGSWAGTAPTKRGDVVAISLLGAGGNEVCRAAANP